MRGLPRLPMRWWLIGSHVLVLALPVVVVLGSGVLAKELRAQTMQDLRNQAAWLSLVVEQTVRHERQDHPTATLTDVGHVITPVLVRAREQTLAGVRVVNHEGIVVASSGEEIGEDLSDRAEVRDALDGAVALNVRQREPPSRNPLNSVSRRATVRVFLGTPLEVDGVTVGALVFSRTPREEVQALYQALPLWTVFVPVLLTIIIALGASRAGTRSLRRLSEASRKLARGELTAVEELQPATASRVSEVGRLAAALATMTERLRDRLAYNAEFAAHVSHEFKTPISTLRGTAELLRDDDAMPADQRRTFLDNALDELERLDRLVTGLLVLARAEEDGARGAVDMDALVQRVVARVDGVDVQGRAGLVPGVEAQLATAVHNLVDNALRYGAAPVQVRLAREDDRVVVTVVDHGEGVAAGNAARVFERFFTTARGDGGTGLGLALVKTVAEAHGGGARLDRVGDATHAVMWVPRG